MTQNDHAVYPLLENEADRLHAASGRAVNTIDLEAVAAGELSEADLQVGDKTLRAQAEIARASGYAELASNLLRAAELTAVPNQDLLQMYEMLRPGRSTYAQLLDLADMLASSYGAAETARFVREAADVYKARRLLKRP